MLKFLKKEANMTHTENGAVTYRSTQSECLDLFATIGALRRERDEEITNRFLRAYAEDADLAMKTLFFARDIRGGIGERRVFRTILKWLANNEPRSLEKNIQYIAEYGRYDDLLVLMGTTCEGKVLQLIKKQLAADCAALEAGESVSLLAKWLPSVNASNEDVIRQAKRIARAMGMNDAQYRKTLSALRTKISIIENNLREKDYTFDYSKQPSKAMFKYRKAFMRNDGDRYDEFMSRVAEGTEQLHTGTLTPYEMIKPFFGHGDISDQERKAIDATWKTQEDFTGGENALVVIDGSGSMYGGADPIPATPSSQTRYQIYETQIDDAKRKIEKFNQLKAALYGDFADGLLSHQDYTDLSEDYSRRADDLRIFIAELEKEKEKYSVGFGSKMQWALLIEKYKDQESLDAEMAAAFIETLTLFNDGHVEVAFRHRDEIEQVLYVAATRGKEAERYAG